MHDEKDLQDELPLEFHVKDKYPRRPGTTILEGQRPPFRWRLWALLALAIIALIVWPAWAGFYTDWLFFQELGFQVVFSTVLKTELFAGVIVGAIAAILFYLNVRLALRLSGAQGEAGYKFNIGSQQIAVADLGNILAKLALPIAGVVGAIFGAQGWSAWNLFLQFRYGQPFGEVDPILGHDIGFYFFKLPLYELLSGILESLIIFCFVAALVVYLGRAALTVNLAPGASGQKVSMLQAPRNHLLILLAGFFAVLAVRTYLDLPALLLGSDSNFTGASYTDIHATMPLLWVKIGVCALTALLALAGMILKRGKIVGFGIALFILVFVAGVIYPAMVQRFSVAPNELERESPYIAHNIKATRKAFNLDQVEERELGTNVTLNAKDIQDNRRTINGIRIWDQKPLLETFSQLQEIRPYYGFQSVDNDRYLINGEIQQVMLSVRELESAMLPNRNWINERFIFTHGYGLTLGPVNQITPEGLPVLYVKDIPPVSTLPNLKIDRPEIYFGEMENSHAFVKTKQQEFNYPQGDENKFSTYEGTGGVGISSYLRKLMFATRLGELKLMLSNDVTAESRVLFYRNIKERLEKIAPFLKFDHDPYLVISSGKCFWICDAYTVGDQYPYAQFYYDKDLGRVNYMRNSVKAVIDAYNGSVQLYIADEKDPLIKTYEQIFPGILQPLTDMPADLRAHIRYPEDIFNFQTAVYSTYHMDQPQVFYNKEDQWEIASAEEQDGKAVAMSPYYTIMKLPEVASEEFLVMLPFVPRNKLNLASWMVARCDAENYGKLVVYRIPKQKQIFGPKQIIGRINQDAEISGQLTLWNQKGSKVIFGTMLVIPVKESLLYVQPLYLQSDTGKIPELKRVIVVNENKIAMSENLEQSLTKLFGNGAVQAQPGALETQALTAAPQTPISAGLATQAKEHYERAMQAQRAGDWAKYGDEIKQLGQLIEKMSQAK